MDDELFDDLVQSGALLIHCDTHCVEKSGYGLVIVWADLAMQRIFSGHEPELDVVEVFHSSIVLRDGLGFSWRLGEGPSHGTW